jgi:hypothetical protein
MVDDVAILQQFYHFSLFAQKAALILPLAMFLACLALKLLRLALLAIDSPSLAGLPLTPC